ncbi:MAG: 2,3-bisphosphoglycerate-independent phosphoglycerate mutase, partial [Planctomycetes bacterium]|nr:2,3-bisphosphoglycerate-independent phosphoglycerate mutase [Planctomycetota bacterium]
MLNKFGKFSGIEGPVVTIVLDGFGINPKVEGNAITNASTPVMDHLLAKYSNVALKAHGVAVGLPSDDDMGNSEVGHNALGC